jgi:hypothetical protein
MHSILPCTRILAVLIPSKTRRRESIQPAKPCILPTKELRIPLRGAIFSRRDANAQTHVVMGEGDRLCAACSVMCTKKRQGHRPNQDRLLRDGAVRESAHRGHEIGIAAYAIGAMP